MDRIPINLLPPAESGRLYYVNYNPPLDDLVYIRRRIPNRASYTLDINAIINFDLDDQLILQAVELIIPRKHWKIDPTSGNPFSSKEAVIQILSMSERRVSLDMPISAVTDDGYRNVFFSWEAPGANDEWISLSDECFALISDKWLKGILVKLT